MRIDGLKIIISFLLGVGFCWVFIDKYNGDILLLFQTAYETGKQDGYSLGHSDRSKRLSVLSKGKYVYVFICGGSQR